MSGLDLALRNLAAWSLQVGVLALSAAILSRLLPVERPAARLALGQALLVLVLGLPLLQPWPAARGEVSFFLAPAASLAFPPPAASVPDGRALPSGTTVVAAVLLAGAAVRLGQLLVGLARLRSLRGKARPLLAPPWLLARRDEVAPRASLVLCAGTGRPATFGLRRPVVLLPPAFEAMARDRQEAVALHELLHVRRGDWIFLAGEELLKAVLFFHPAVHWLVGRVRLAREQTVDAEVVRRLGARGAYLDSLVEVARVSSRSHAVPAAPFLRESHLRERVDLLLKEVLMSRARTLAHLAATAAAVVLATAWAASAVPLQSAAFAPPGKAGAKDAAPAPVEPKLVHRVTPAYPPEAKAEGAQGLFVIAVVIGKDGAIRSARVVVSAPTVERLKELEPRKGTPLALEGDARLAAAALDAVRQWRYEPILMGGKPADFEATVTVNFKLA